MSEARILLGVVGRPHGVRGHVRVHSYTADPAELARYAPLVDDHGRRFSLRWVGEGIAELRTDSGEPVADRTAAERLVNTRLYVARNRLPATEEDEFYLADLIGLPAQGEDGRALGRVVAVHDYGAGTSIEIASENPPLLVPFTRAAVPVVDLAARRLTVVPPVEVASR